MDRSWFFLIHGPNVDNPTEINEGIDFMRTGSQHTHSSGPTIEVIEPATQMEIEGAVKAGHLLLASELKAEIVVSLVAKKFADKVANDLNNRFLFFDFTVQKSDERWQVVAHPCTWNRVDPDIKNYAEKLAERWSASATSESE